MSLQQALFSSSNRITAIVGICKNAGKTTVLNYLLQSFPKKHFGVLTTGHDGEKTDILYGNPKQSVKLPDKTIFCTDSVMVDKLGARILILQKLDWKSGKRQLWIVQANEDLECEIYGPSVVEQQVSCAKLLLELGMDQIIIDGSLDRKSIVLSPAVDDIVISIGSSFGSLEQIRAELVRLSLLNSIPLSDKIHLINGSYLQVEKNGQWIELNADGLLSVSNDLLDYLTKIMPCDSIYFGGAFTQTMYNRLIPIIKTKVGLIIVQHPHNIKLNTGSLERLLQDFRVETVIPFRIKAITINSYSTVGNHVDCSVMMDALKAEIPTVELIDVLKLD